ncbi:MAG: hypothetical protein AB8B97_22840 [Granulosicoccus sp.]
MSTSYWQTRVRDALSAAGIEFARREVKVRLPEELEDLQIKDFERKLLSNSNDSADSKVESSLATAAAAAISATVAQDIANQDGDDVIDDR